MQSPVIHIANLSKQFGRLCAVNNLSIEIDHGEVFAFLGSNGSGKTTTFRCLLGIYTPDSGTAHIHGQPYSSALRNTVGYLPEERGIYTRARVLDTLHYFAQLHGLSREERTRNIDEYLERVGLTAHGEQRIDQLSSGMQQKVQIGAAIVHEPSVLILDEPFKGLDPLNRQLFLDLFEERRQRGATILYSTHVVDEVQKLATRIVMLKNGSRVLYGSVDEIRNKYSSHTLTLTFSGTLPEHPELYQARVEHNYAELVPAEGVVPNRILRLLVDTPGLELREFKFDRPSLNTIFIQEAQHTHNHAT